MNRQCRYWQDCAQYRPDNYVRERWIRKVNVGMLGATLFGLAFWWLIATAFCGGAR